MHPGNIQPLAYPQELLPTLSAGQIHALAAVLDLRVSPASGGAGIAGGNHTPRLQQRVDFRPGEAALDGVRLAQGRGRTKTGGQQEAAEQEPAYHISTPSSVSMA